MKDFRVLVEAVGIGIECPTCQRDKKTRPNLSDADRFHVFISDNVISLQCQQGHRTLIIANTIIQGDIKTNI